MKHRLFGALLTLLASPVMAQTPQWESWVVSWDLARSTQAVARYGASLSGIGIFAYHFDSEGHVIPATKALTSTVPPLLRRLPKARLWVSFNNDRETGKQIQLKDPAIMHTLLKNPQRRARLTDELLSVLQQADGLEIDVENLRAKDRDAFSQWIRELAGELHAHQKMLSVVVQPRTQDKIKDGAGAMDWSALSADADQVKVMAYHFHHAHGDSGPVAPPEWVVQLVHFAQPSIPPEKLSVVLTLSGFDWPKNGVGRAISFEEAIAKSKQAGAAVERDPATGTPHFEYTENGIRHTVWFEDAVSLRKKIDALHEAGVFQIALWRLGTGDSAFWESLIKTGP